MIFYPYERPAALVLKIVETPICQDTQGALPSIPSPSSLHFPPDGVIILPEDNNLARGSSQPEA